MCVGHQHANVSVCVLCACSKRALLIKIHAHRITESNQFRKIRNLTKQPERYMYRLRQFTTWIVMQTIDIWLTCATQKKRRTMYVAIHKITFENVQSEMLHMNVVWVWPFLDNHFEYDQLYCCREGHPEINNKILQSTITYKA